MSDQPYLYLYGKYRQEVPGCGPWPLINTLPGNASGHLGKAWAAAFDQEPNPSTAYSEAIKAVEAAAIPVVLPNDPLATLGKVVGELRANPAEVRGGVLAGRVTGEGHDTVAARSCHRACLLAVGQPDRQARGRRAAAERAGHLAAGRAGRQHGGHACPHLPIPRHFLG